MKIAVCTPVRDFTTPGYTYDLVYLLSTLKDCVYIPSIGSTVLANSRDGLVKTAMLAEATHIIWLDADMRFPKDTALRLLESGKQIVGANYRHRQAAKLWTASLGKDRITSVGKSGLERVDQIGFGCVLTSIEVFASMEQPWFHNVWQGSEWTSEDVGFCRKAVREGFEIFVDHDLSQQVKHIGTVELGVE